MGSSSPPATNPSTADDSSVLPSTEMTPDRTTPAAVPKKRKAAEARADSNIDDESVAPKKNRATPAPAPKPRQRKSAGSVNAARPIGRGYAECDDFDKKLIDMYNDGKKWAEIRIEWEKLTGDKVAQSTLPNRYERLMNNFAVIPDFDKTMLIAAKQEVEKAFEKERWSKIAAEMQKKGTALYKPMFLERQHKKMILDAEKLPPVPIMAKSVKKVVPKVEEDESILGDDEE